MIRHVIFDLGGVLIDWNPKYVYRTIFDSEEKVDWFIDNITTYKWNVQQDAGRSLSEATSILVSKHPEYQKEIEAYYSRWTEMLGGPIDGTVNILRQIIDTKQYKVLALTNWSAETFPIALERYDFLGWFEGIVVSGDEKCMKPDAKIYNILLSRYYLQAEECLFIDDNMENVQGAKSLGINAVQFKNPDQLIADLEQYNILFS